MQVGVYIDGRPLTYDEGRGLFAIAGAEVTPELVRAYWQAGQIEWRDSGTSAWFDASFPQLTAPPQVQLLPQRKRRVWLIVAVLLGVVVACPLAAVGITALTVTTGNADGATSTTVTKVTEDPSLVGKRIKVLGSVVPSSWDQKNSPMQFDIREEGDDAGEGPTLTVIYAGDAPSAFSDGATVIVTGELTADDTIESNDMIAIDR